MLIKFKSKNRQLKNFSAGLIGFIFGIITSSECINHCQKTLEYLKANISREIQNITVDVLNLTSTVIFLI